MNQPIKGYKVTDEKMQCRGFQYELGKRYNHSGEVIPCYSGFHYCELPADCFGYYSFSSTNRVFEILDHGKSVKDGDKTCTSEIEFVRELAWQEVLTVVNSGLDNTGMKNSGNWNSGNWNSGDRNSGNRNSGDRNSGNWNSGNWNSGNRNSGNWNSGNWNSGDRNSGDRNSGDSNSGNWNSGNWNSGNRNLGNWNSGNWNSGDRNSGDSNSGYRNDGAFCTDKNPTIRLFDKETNISVRDWENGEVCNLMYRIEPNIWVDSSMMSDDEKAKHPKHETTGGYLKSIPIHEAWANFWGNLNDEKKSLFTSLQNFDKKKFKEITGIKL